jgi:hypothetical protein
MKPRWPLPGNGHQRKCALGVMNSQPSCWRRRLICQTQRLASAFGSCLKTQGHVKRPPNTRNLRCSSPRRGLPGRRAEFLACLRYKVHQQQQVVAHQRELGGTV